MLVNYRKLQDIEVTNDEFEYVGLRVQDGDFGMSIGQAVTHESSVWVDGEQLDETLLGICAVSKKELHERKLNFGYYAGDHVIVLGSNFAGWGEDDGEIVMEKAIVLDIIRL